MAEQLKAYIVRQRATYMFLLVTVAMFFGISFSFWYVWNASAAITEAEGSPVDYGSFLGITKVAPNSGISTVAFKLTSSTVGATLMAVNFTVTNVSGTTSGDFSQAMIFKDSNNNDALDMGGADSQLGSTSTVNVGTTTTITLDVPAVIPDSESGNWNYILAFMVSSTSSDGDSFVVQFASTTETYVLSSGTVSSNGINSAVYTVDSAAPTLTATGGPPNGQTGVPVDAMVDRVFSENITSATVTTSSVLLQANTGNTLLGAPAGTNLCTSVSLVMNTRILCNHVSDGIPLATSTWYTITYGVGITDKVSNPLVASSTYTFQTGSLTPGNNTTPPFVVSSAPQPGSSEFPINGNLQVEFSQAMETVTAGSVTSTSNISLQTVSGGVPGGSNLCASSGCTITWDATERKILINPAVDLSASSDYLLIVSRNSKNSAGVSLNNGTMDYNMNFRTASGSDSTAATSTAMYPASAATGVQRDLPAITVNFSEALNGSTVTTATAQLFYDANANFAADGGEEVLTDFTSTSTLRYDSAQKAIFIGIKKLLYQNKQYCVKLVGGASGFKDIVGNQSLSSVKCFTTVNSAFTAVAPTVSMVDADNYRAWVQFSGPVQESGATTAINFTLQNETSGTDINTANAVFTYKPERSAVEITGLALTTGDLLKVTVTSVNEFTGAVSIVANDTTNVGKTKVFAAGGNFASTQPEFSQTNFATFAVNPKRCAPASLSAGKTTRLMCEFPVPTALATGAKITLTAPVGSSVANVTALSAANSPMNGDINGPGPGVTTISAVVTSTSAGTIELTLAHSGTAMTNSDMLRFELDNFVNPAAGQKTFSAIIKDASGYKQGETIYPAPFTISAAGNLDLGGRVCKSNTSGGTCGFATGVSGVKIVIQNTASSGSGSMGGTEIATTDGDGAYIFSNLSIGQYQVMMFVDPSAGETLGGGNNMQMISLSSSVNNADFKLTDLSSDGKTLTASITGGPASKDFDLFCYAPGNASSSAPVMKKGTTNGSGAATVTMKLRANTNYECGIGPSIPVSSMTSGGPPPVPEFSFIPPKPQTVVVGSVDVSANFVLASASQKIIGKVQDNAGTGIPNVFVQASPVGCFDASTGAAKDCRGSFSQTKSDGTFTINVTPGTYGVNACFPGMPCSAPVEVTVKANTVAALDSNSDADVYSKGTLLTGTGLTIKMSKSDYTISGAVQDENSSGIKYAFVNAQLISSGGTCNTFTPLGGFTGSPTDSSGNYTLYVGVGTWVVRANAPAYGEVACSVITVSTESKSSQNLKATASDYGTISGTVQKNSSATQGANINCFGSSGGNFAISSADGTYSMKVKSGTYSCDGFIPGAGQLTLQTDIVVADSGSTTVNLSMGNPGTITVNAGVTDAFCDARSTTGRGAGTGQNSSGVYTINVPAGTYTVRCGNPKVGQIGSQSVLVTAGGSHSVTFTAPTTFTVSGVVNDGTNNLEGAFITFVDKTNGRAATIQSNGITSGNNISIALPAGTYSVSASKSGYVDSAAAQTLTLTANTSITTRILTKATAAVSIAVQASGENYGGESRIIATKSDGKVVVVSADKAVTSGPNASLVLTNGTWSVKAVGDNGKESTATTIVVTDNVPSSNSISPSLANAITGFTPIEANQQSITPSSGGLITDTEISNGTQSLQVNIPSGVLSTSDSSAGTLETKTNPTLAVDSPGMEFVGTSAIDITPKSADGNAITSLSGSATLIIPYTDEDVTAAGVTESKLTCGAWSEASGAWETLSTTVDTTNNTLTCQTTHFSTFGVLAGNTGGSSDSGGGGGGGDNGGGGGGGGGAVINTNPPILPKQNTDEKKNAITINAGAKETVSQTVIVTLSATNATEMALSNMADFNGSSYVPYATSASWTLTEGNGEKTVYIKFRSKEGGTINTSDTIILTGQTKEQVKQVVETPKTTTPGPSSNASPVAKFMFQKNMANGAKSNDVKELQKRLRALGLFTYPTDTGTYASMTANAVKAYQKANGLKQTGIVDIATRAKLNASETPAVVIPKITDTTSVPTTGFTFKKNLIVGSRSADVKELQARLRALGFFDYPTDTGLYGLATVKAVRAFQKANGLSAVGIVGPQTRAALNK